MLLNRRPQIFGAHRGCHAKIFGWAKSAAYDWRSTSNLWPIAHNIGIGDKQKSCVMCVKFSKEWKTILHIVLLKFLWPLTNSSFKILCLRPTWLKNIHIASCCTSRSDRQSPAQQLVCQRHWARGRYCYEYLPFKLILLTNIQAIYWWGQMHCGPPNQTFGWAPGPRYTLQRPPPIYWSWQTIKKYSYSKRWVTSKITLT